MRIKRMTSERRRNFTPTESVEAELDKLPLLQRSRIINEALESYFGQQQEMMSDIEDIKKGIDDIKKLLAQALKARK